jgi:Cutinase/PKD domain
MRKYVSTFRAGHPVGAVSLVLSVAVLALLTLGPPASARAACPPYEVIGARGSGQNDPDLLKQTQDMGPEVHDFYVSLRVLIGSGTVKGYGVHYPAVNVVSPTGLAALLHLGGGYTDSVRAGANDVLARIKARHARCGDHTRFVLAGYSQGAQVMGDVLKHAGILKRVAAVALFGDPYFNADSWSARGGFDSSEYGVFGPRPEWPSSLYGRVFSYCHWHDIICNESVRHHVWGTDLDVYVRSTDHLLARDAAHGTPAYRLKAHKGQGDAGMAARDVARALGFIPAPLSFSGPLDVAFVIDSTGSMWDEIDEVKENVTALAGQISAIDPDYRLALVDYKDTLDQESEYQSRLDLDFTTDVAVFDLELNALEAEGGGDTPESVYSGLMTALNLGWRPGSKKIVVQIGDAPAKDPEPVTGYTLHSVQAKALGVDPATIDTIQSGENEETAASFQQVAAATGGQFLQLPESALSGLVPAIVDEIRQNTTAPVAVLTAPSHAVAGRPLTLSAAASHDLGEAIAGYDWDFNGDGVFDASTTSPVASYTYPTPTAVTATVRVHSASGLAGLATAPIVVVAPVKRHPRRPVRLHRTVRRTKVKLSWAAGKGAAPQWFTVFAPKGRVLTRIAVSGNAHRAGARKRRFSVVVQGLRRHHRYLFWVAAGNEAGESRRTGPVTVMLGRRGRGHRGAKHRH